MTTQTTPSKAASSMARYPSLAGQRVFVTGGGTGIGAAIVESFAQQGAQVAFVDMAESEPVLGPAHQRRRSHSALVAPL
jgi:NAD(P)-dependent dehydrogenase (short-subunit alcohol dehydrogenase family)